MNLSEAEWKIFGEAPLAIFALVAMSDGRLSDREREVFVEEWAPKLQDFRFSSDPREHEVYRWVLMDSAVRLRDQKEFDLERCRLIVKKTGTILQKRLDSQEADSIRKALLLLARDVALASAGLLNLGEQYALSEKWTYSTVQRLLESGD